MECENAKRHGSKGAWFHLRCAGLSRSDLDASWYCPACQANESSDSPDEQDDSDDSNFNDKKPGSQRMRKPSQKPTSSRKGAVATSVGSGSNSRKNIKGGGSSNAALQTSSSTRPAYSQNAAEKNTSKWTNREGQMVAILMREVISEGVVNHTESRWDVVAARLSFRFAVDRTASAVKNYWNRYGRAANPSLDERRTARPDKLVTGVQDPVSRRKARGLKRKAASDEQDNVEEDNDEEDSDEASIPISRQIYSSKRRRI